MLGPTPPNAQHSSANFSNLPMSTALPLPAAPSYLWCWRNAEGQWCPFDQTNQKLIEEKASQDWGYVDISADENLGEDSLTVVFDPVPKGNKIELGELESLSHGPLKVQRFGPGSDILELAN